MWSGQPTFRSSCPSRRRTSPQRSAADSAARSQDSRQQRGGNQDARRKMTGEAVARVKNVSHRYGATVSLADVSIDIPSRIMVGVIGPDGVGKSTLLGLIAGVKVIQSGEVVVFDKTIANKETLREHPRPHRLYAAGPRPQPLPDALRVREHRLLRPIVRIVGDGASRQDRPSFLRRRAWRSSKRVPPASCPAA